MAKEEVATATEEPKKKGPQMVITETSIPGGDVIRRLVSADTDPEDLPEGSNMLSVEESRGIMRKQTKPEIIRVGDKVRRKPGKGDAEVNEEDQGYVDAQLKREADSGAKMVRVKWEKSMQSTREDPINLTKIW